MDNHPAIDITPQNWQIVSSILRQWIPDCEVWAFGSRVKGTAKEFSDLDLAVIGSQPLGLTQMAELVEAFRESMLPFKVDVVDWAEMALPFREIVQQNKVVVQAAKQTPTNASLTNKSIGIAQGKFKVPDDIDAHNDEVARLFSGEKS